MANQFNPSDLCGRGHISICCESYSKIVQGTWTFGVNNAQAFNGVRYNEPAAQNDAIEYRVCLPAGVYDLRILTMKQPTQAIMTLKIDGVIKSTFDGYDGGGMLYNQHWNDTGIEILESGWKTLQIIAATRNPLASGWYAVLTWLSLWQPTS